MEIGRYRIVRPLGRGGTAEVFEAIAEGAGGFTRRVAIKRLLAGNADEPAFVRMFLDEARIGSQLHHASIVAVLDYGVSNGAPFQVLQFVDGIDAVSLFELAAQRGRELPIEIVLHICTEIAHALHYAHTATDERGRSLGIVHRDVSPANILVSYGADVLLADFGIAFAKDRSERTAVGMTKGTLSYCAPEQATGGVVDQRADVFALAATCHRLICGRSPLAGEHALADLLAGAALPIDPRIPDDVAAILRRALERDRTARHRDAAVFADALGSALASRIATDPRSMLRAFLNDVRAQARAPAGKLDALLGLDLELVVVGEHEGVRTFEERTITRGPSELPPTVAEPTPPPRARKRWMTAAIAVAIGGAAWGATRIGNETAALSTPMLSPIPVPAPRPQPPAVVAPTIAPPAETPPAEEIRSAPPTVEPTSAPPPLDRAKPARPITSPKAKPATTAAPTTADAAGSGFVTIGGAKALNAEIRVDGKSIGYAPKRFALDVGDHKIVLVSAAGQTIASKHATVTPRNTATSPLRWIVE